MFNFSYFSLKLNHASETLFDEFIPDFSVKDRNNYLKYLPSYVKSMKFNIETKATLTPSLGKPESNIEWSELKRFESVNNKSVYCINNIRFLNLCLYFFIVKYFSGYIFLFGCTYKILLLGASA